MANILFIAGLLFTVAGLALVIVGYRQPPEVPPKTGPEGFGEDVAKAVESVTNLLKEVEKRFRIGVLVMMVGLTLIGVGAFVKATDAKNAADDAPDQATASSAATLIRPVL
jgi:hypothetical protein